MSSPTDPTNVSPSMDEDEIKELLRPARKHLVSFTFCNQLTVEKIEGGHR